MTKKDFNSYLDELTSETGFDLTKEQKAFAYQAAKKYHEQINLPPVIMTFTIIEHKETGEKWLAKPYWLDPSSKWTLFADYKENEEPIFTEWGLGMNEYRSEVKVIGKFETDKVSVSRENHLTFN